MALDELLEFRELNAVQGAKCWYGQLDIKPADRALLDKAMADPAISARAISLWLENRGFDVKYHSISRHVRKDCRCNNG
jgi:hypothetical protein